MSALDPALRRLRWQVFSSTWLCYAGFYVTRKVFSVVKGDLKQQLQIDDLGVSHLWTTYLVAYMLGQFIAAALGKRYSSRALLIGGMGVSVAANLGAGFVLPAGPSAFGPLLALMAVHGIAQAMGWPHNIGIVANWTRRSERGTVMSFWATCYQIGGVAAKALAAFVFGAMGLLWSFWASSLALALILVLFVLWGHNDPESKGVALPSEVEGSPAAAQGAKAAAKTTSQFFAMVVSMGLIYFGFKFLRYALDSWSALILREHFALSTEVAGYYSTAFDWVGFLGVLSSGPVSDKLFKGERLPVIFFMSAGCFLATAALWAVGLSSITAFVVLLGLVGFMAMGPDALLSGAGAMDVGTARQAALAAGVINGVGSIGPIVQEPIIGFLKTNRGLESVFFLLVVVAGLATVGTAVFWWGTRRSARAL